MGARQAPFSADAEVLRFAYLFNDELASITRFTPIRYELFYLYRWLELFTR